MTTVDTPIALRPDGVFRRDLVERAGDSVMLWAECYSSNHPRGNTAAQATARSLATLGVDFAILGPEERCVADSQRLAGETGIFEEAAERNLETLGKYELSLLVTPDPHAY